MVSQDLTEFTSTMQNDTKQAVEKTKETLKVTFKSLMKLLFLFLSLEVTSLFVPFKGLRDLVKKLFVGLAKTFTSTC